MNHRADRRRGRWLMAGAALVLAAWCVLVGRAFVLAGADLHDGMTSIDQVQANVTVSNLTSGASLVGLRRAQGDFSRVDHRLRGPLFLAAWHLPVLGRQLRALSAQSAAAADASAIASRSVSAAEAILKAPAGPLDGEARSVQSLGVITDQARRQLNALSFGPAQGLVAPLAHGRQKLTADLAQVKGALARASAGAAALGDLLSRTHHYLILAANEAEMRAGSGMFLSAGVLVTGANGLSLGPMQTVTTISVPAGVPLTGDLAARWGWLAPNQEWRNLMVSPRFPASAALAAQMWVASGHPAVDGVIAIDSVALQHLLEAVGPVTVDAVRIDAVNVLDELLNGQYFRFGDDQTDQRREELGQVADAAFGRLAQGGTSRAALADGLVRAAEGRHIMVWSQAPAEEAAWRDLGVDGDLTSNSLLVSVLNRGGNKLDYFLRVSTDVSFRPAGRDTEVTLRISLHNRVPVAEEPFDVVGPDIHSGVGAGVYLGIVSVNMPAQATDGRFDGVAHLAVAGSDGPTEVMAFQLQVGPEQTRVVTAHFMIPGRKGVLRVQPSARVPGIVWTSGSDSWPDSSGYPLRWNVS